MIQEIIKNMGTIAVTLVLLGIVIAVIFKLRQDRKKGKSTCGGTCGCCPMSGSCHKQW